MKNLRQVLGLLALARTIQGDTLPYNPARIFLPPNSSYAFIFGPSSTSNDQAQLSALDISDSFSTTNHEFSTISDALPFLQQDELLPYAPALDASGNITVVAGKCSEKASSAQVWQFQPDLDSSTAKGAWRQRSASYQEGEDVTGYAGLGYLSNSIAFSDSVDSDGKDTSVYVFGGMCPYDNSTTGTWISRAEYSNSMLTISPDASDYDISLAATRGPPITQAGSSITALPPTYGMSASGSAQTQQQDFVLLGGNTQAAFINMSQVALFSLPQQSWSFIDVLQPTSEKTDLTIRRAAQEITPRSGHTAVLSESGDTIILFGGWVGDVNTPADPQLAILELGAGYGGSGEWKWTIPQQSGSGPDVGTGIYGHGATILPGGIMMVIGGYEIPASPSSRAKRSSQTGNTRMFLYDTTSHSWLGSYSPPANVQSSGKSSGPLSTTSAKVGLGTGLGIGAALLLSMVGFYIWYGKRLKAAQEDRERALLSYSSDGSTIGQLDKPFLYGGIDGRGGDEAAIGRPWSNGAPTDSLYPKPPQMQHSTGAWVNVPSPTRGLRKGSAGKYQYHAAPRYDDKRISRGSGNIHPIVEHENEDEQEYVFSGTARERMSNVERRLPEVERIQGSEDPFNDNEPNPLGSHPVAPIASGTVRRVPTNASTMPPLSRPQRSNEKYDANWIVEETTRGVVFEEQEHGFAIVNGDDRTSSTLSERSQHSTTSTSSITRTMSTRTGALLAAAGAAHRIGGGSPQRSPTHERSNTLSTNASSQSPSHSRARARSSTQGSIVGGDGDSFMSARSNFIQLQGEGEALLGGRRAIDPDDPYQRALAAQSSTTEKMQHLLYNSGPPPPIPPRRRPGLMGSLRRALNVVSMGDRSVSFAAAEEHYEEGVRTSSSSPTKDRTNTTGNGPRRAVSDGGPLLRQKRGQKDWDEKEWPPYRDNPDGGDWGEPRSSDEVRQAEGDWDVESAATNRDFQVMFSIPKSKLRVVNDDMDRASLRSASDGGLSRSGSVRREGSIKPFKSRTEDGENPRLPSTEEEQDELEKEKAA